MNKSKDKCAYASAVFGKNVLYRTDKLQTSVGSVWSRVLRMNEVKKGFVAITTSVNELLEEIGTGAVLLIDSTSRTASNDDKDNKYKPSGILLLALIGLNRQQKGHITWNKSHHEMMKKYKKNIIKGSNKHHGSNGCYYAYGNKAYYGMVGNSSVSQYTSKNCGLIPCLEGLCVTELSQMELQCGITELQHHIPNLPSLISPIISIAHAQQKVKGDINLKEISSSKDGLWQINMCVNAETTQYHIERDCTYTIIHVPQQVKYNVSSKYHFMFKTADDMNIAIPMQAGSTILFTGQFLTHRQSGPSDSTADSGTFFNFSSYGNEKLFRHIKKSLGRVNCVK